MKDFITHNEKDIDICSSFFQGYLETTYKELVEKLGEPIECSMGDKEDAEWHICFNDGTKASIYNYKNGKNYCGPSGLEVYKIKKWHIGGFTQKAVDMVNALFS